MKTATFMDALKRTAVNTEAIRLIEKKYNCILNEDLRKIISVSTQGIFFENNDFCRSLPLVEIINADTFLHFSFTSLRMLPLFDKGDNNFIVYKLINNDWCFVNIIDKGTWGTKTTLLELL